MKPCPRLGSGFLLLLLCWVYAVSPLWTRGQSTLVGDVDTATSDRLEDPGWWPTKGSYPRDSFAGSAACQQCHADLFRTQITTPMALAGRRGSDTKIVAEHTRLVLANGPYNYNLQEDGSGPVLSVTDGAASDTTPLNWAFGSGELGQTYLYQRDGRWFESRISLYAKSDRLDITTGHSPLPPESLHDALGRGLKEAEAQQCFSCHTTGSTNAGHFESLSALPGITCEACHGPGAAHVQAAKAGHIETATSAIMDPGRLGPVASVDFCGACHRTWADVAFSGATQHGVEVVRFQPYRLEKSRCWGSNGDARLICTSCHDPHLPLVRAAAAYDVQCLSCHVRRNEVTSHAKPGAACPQAVGHCTTCHMPKVTVPEMHGEFTDHFIRIVSRTSDFPQ